MYGEYGDDGVRELFACCCFRLVQSFFGPVNFFYFGFRLGGDVSRKSGEVRKELARFYTVLTCCCDFSRTEVRAKKRVEYGWRVWMDVIGSPDFRFFSLWSVSKQPDFVFVGDNLTRRELNAAQSHHRNNFGTKSKPVTILSSPSTVLCGSSTVIPEIQTRGLSLCFFQAKKITKLITACNIGITK